MVLDVGFVSRTGERRTGVVDGIFAAQPGKRFFDGTGVEAPPCQALADLCFRQLTPCKQPETDDVRVHPLSLR